MVRRRGEQGITLILSAMMFGLMIIPAAGLAVDAGLMYLVKVRLSAAADAAALAGARAFSRGSAGPEQNANAEATASTYFTANYPAGYFWSFNPTISAVGADEGNQMRSVTTQASVQLPMLFMRIFRDNPSIIRARAKATRRDTNIMIVMDRSGSLANSGACNPLKTAAANFVEKFSEGRDNLGLITFATSSRIDRALSNTFKTSVRNTLTALVCSGATNTAQGLWQGYEALVTLNQPGAFNVIVLFSDGLPTAVTEDFPLVTAANGGTCTSPAPPGPIRGVLTVTTGGNPIGLYTWQAPAQPYSSDQNLVSNGTNCRFRSNQQNVAQDLQYAPLTDIWGNSLNATGYRSVTMTGAGAQESSGSNITRFCTNAADHAGLRVRRGDTVPSLGRNLQVTIMTIGYGPDVDTTLMQRIANDPNLSPNPVAAGRQGRYYYAGTAAALDLAFTRVASEVLRLAQ
ncbi:MAG: VWA domain-containing protein [Bryobacterales bacterium]|nr:VWA domain-containing protein [Bryobacterales bacterium]